MPTTKAAMEWSMRYHRFSCSASSSYSSPARFRQITAVTAEGGSWQYYALGACKCRNRRTRGFSLACCFFACSSNQNSICNGFAFWFSNYETIALARDAVAPVGFVETTPNNYGLINQKTSASIRNQSNCMEAIIRHRSCALEASMMMLLLMLMMTVTPAIGHWSSATLEVR